MANSSNRGGSRPGAGRKKKNPDGTYEHAAFSAEQLKELTDSPHVAYVSSKTVSYTKAFKDAAWQRYCDGVDPIQIFSEVGLNPETLGRARILGFLSFCGKQKDVASSLPKEMILIRMTTRMHLHCQRRLVGQTKGILH